MQKLSSVLIWTLSLLIILQPAATIIFTLFGYSFVFKANTALAIIIGVVSVFLTVLILLNKNINRGKSTGILIPMLPPISLVNIVMHIIVYKKFNLTIAIGLFVSTICLCLLTLLCAKSLSLKVASLVLSGLMILPISLLSFVSIAFNDFGETKVVRSIESPNGCYCAEIISNDQGALGGNTIIKIQYNNEISNFLFKISKKPQEIYFGKWYEFENIDVQWKDNSILIINSKEYNIE